MIDYLEEARKANIAPEWMYSNPKQQRYLISEMKGRIRAIQALNEHFGKENIKITHMDIYATFDLMVEYKEGKFGIEVKKRDKVSTAFDSWELSKKKFDELVNQNEVDIVKYYSVLDDGVVMALDILPSPSPYTIRLKEHLLKDNEPELGFTTTEEMFFWSSAGTAYNYDVSYYQDEVEALDELRKECLMKLRNKMKGNDSI